MKRSSILLTAALLASTLPAFAQGNIDSSRLQEPSHSTAPKPDCRPQPVVTPHGIEYTGCSDKPESVDRSKFDPKSVDGPSAGNAGKGSSADMDPQTRTKYQAALQAQYDYKAFSFLHAKRTFEFQYTSGRIIFWVVLLIVFAGLAFSAVQFYVGLHHPLESRAKTDGKDAASSEECVSEFEASLQGIKLKSSVLGLLILAMSMVFFYLYLKYVYPITNVAGPS